MYDYEHLALTTQEHYFNNAENSKEARKENPMEDKIISELCFEVLTLMDKITKMKCGDIAEHEYQALLYDFKEKWLKKDKKELYKKLIEEETEELKKELLKSINNENPYVLLPCPCYNERPTIHHYVQGTAAKCSKCGKMSDYTKNTEEAIKNWNEMIKKQD